jgi:hypothetical protein
MRTLPILLLAAVVIGTPTAPAASPVTPDRHPVLDGFHRAVRQYVELHRVLEAGLPPLVVTSDAEQLRRAVDARASALRAARPDARVGDIFTKEGGQVLRWRIHAALDRNGYEASVLLRAMAADEESACQPVTVNGPFPWMAGTAMWPFVIDALPELPAELEYRFVGRDLVLLDVHAELVVDVLPNALPLW